MAVPNKDIASHTVHRYQEVIDTVIGNARRAFAEEGCDESVLEDLRAIWETKLVATGVVGEPSSEGQQVIQQQQLQQTHRAVPPPVTGLPLAGQHPQQQPLHQQPFLARPAYPAGMPGVMPVGLPNNMYMAGGAQQLAYYQQFAAAQAQAQAEHKRKLETAAAASSAPEAKLQRTIPQQDGPADDAGGYSDGGGEAAEGEVAAQREEEEEDDEDPLTEDDEEGSGDEVDEAAVPNVVLGQFEKVQRSKSKWKVVLKDCVLTLNGRDYLVRKCNGEMEF